MDHRRGRVPWLPYAAIVVVGLLAYGRTVTFDFVGFDDDRLINERAAYLARPSTLIDAFGRSYWYATAQSSESYYRPIVTVTFVIDALIAPSSPAVSHATNIILHLLASLLLYALLARLYAPSAGTLLVSLLFAAHPLAANAVGWVPGRNDVLLAIFALLALRAWITYAEEHRTRHLLIYAAALVAALFTKESAAPLPVACAFFSIQQWRRSDRTALAHLSIVSIAALVVWWVVRSAVLTGSATMTYAFFANLPIVIQGIGKMIIPLGYSAIGMIDDTSYVWGIIAWIGIGVVIWRAPKAARRRMLPGGAWLVLMLLPSLFAVFQTRPSFLECRLYVPMIGAAIAAGALPWRERLAWRGARGALAALLVAIAVAGSWFSTAPYRNARTMWTAAVATSPGSPIAHVNLANFFVSQGEFAGAVREYNAALAIDSTQRMAHYNLGVLFGDQGRYNDAEEEYRREGALYPRNEFAWYGLGIVAYKRGHLDSAVQWTRTAVQCNPRFAPGWRNLAIFAVTMGDRAEASRCVDRLRALNATVPESVAAFLARQSP